ncbi:MAG: sulfite exporter TauE/SafE family protein [Oxalicibacterium faecigallinarum]|uniref:sulfite exporter TauE/SafE family protein n=1 Tax=Oxalicibacterium faecigallinarum TaxID=573741 RepID=UPI0028079E72|nr:sulfite exporter TauE/SafE family protein [Oxalicibacterium faecigallinarum]MDQ7968109.1 sulfite exporter TauE/SafE family protein [Oxalicibacterium faecigallinarum]
MLLMAMTLGGAVGMVLGLTGAGGGVLAMPALMLALGYSLTDARPISLIAIGLAALLGSLDGLRRGIVRYRAALWIAAIGIAFAPIGSVLMHYLPARWSVVLFSMLMVYLAWRMFRGASRDVVIRDECDCLLDPDTGRFRWTRRCASWLAGVGSTAGMLTGMFGVGGGFVIVPGLRRISDASLHASVATSLMVIALVSGFSAVTMLLGAASIGMTGWMFVGAAAAGTLVGRVCQPHVPVQPLQKMFAGVMVVAALILGIKALV